MRLVNSTLAALRAIRVNKLRSALTMLGIVLGVSSVIVMMAVGGGASRRIQTDVRPVSPGKQVPGVDDHASGRPGRSSDTLSYLLVAT